MYRDRSANRSRLDRVITDELRWQQTFLLGQMAEIRFSFGSVREMYFISVRLQAIIPSARFRISKHRPSHLPRIGPRSFVDPSYSLLYMNR